jgi:hypothetical protein
MTNLDELVEQARRDRPAPGALSGVARNLGIPVASGAAVVLTSASTAAGVAKAGLSRLALWGLGAGSTVAATSAVVIAMSLRTPAPTPPVVQVAPAVVSVARPVPAPEPQAVAPSPEPEPAMTEAAPRRAPEPATWDEPQLIERARKALASDPRRALALAAEHQRRFPSGALSVEREVILIEALARSGQTGAARSRALAFEARYPKSIHLPRVQALLARMDH